MLQPTTISLKRNLSFKENEVLAKEAEEALLYRDMQSELVQQIMRRLAVVRMEAPSEARLRPNQNMQLRYDAIDAHLAKGLAAIYVISSDEHLLVQETADKIRKVTKAQGFLERDILTVRALLSNGVNYWQRINRNLYSVIKN